MPRPDGDDFAKLSVQIDKLNGQVAALIIYVAHIPGAEEVQPKDLERFLASAAPQPSITTRDSVSPYDEAMMTANKISGLARQIAAGRKARG